MPELIEANADPYPIRTFLSNQFNVPDVLNNEDDVDRVAQYNSTVNEYIKRCESILLRVKSEIEKANEEKERIRSKYSEQILKLKDHMKLPMVKKSSFVTRSGIEIKFKHHNKIIQSVELNVTPQILSNVPEYSDCVTAEVVPERVEYKVNKVKLKEKLNKQYFEDGIDDELFTWKEYQPVEVKL